MKQAKVLEADYLVVGSGALGMAFADTIVAESGKTVVIVDRYDRPGGHWLYAYPFVRLHTASAFYGVNSRALGEGAIDRIGLNAGFQEQASAAEVCAYFDRVMRTQLLPSGRVHYFPKCEYRGDGAFVSLVTGEEHRVIARRIVDATFTDTQVPSRHVRTFAVAEDVRCITPDALPEAASAQQYVVVGAGKTGMDVCLWLLAQGVSAQRISWIMPRDAWLLDRRFYEPGVASWSQRMSAVAAQADAVRDAESLDDLLLRLAGAGQLLRLDPRVVPSRYRCATVSRAELDELRRIEHVVRLGHVHRIDRGRVVLEQSQLATDPQALYIDCSASGIRARPTVPVFANDTITLQPVRTCQQCFSAALIAHVDVVLDDDASKNALCNPIALPSKDVDWLRMFVANFGNQSAWSAHGELRAWIARSRLDLNYGRTSPLTAEENALLQRLKMSIGPAIVRATQLLQPSAAYRARMEALV